MKIQLHSKLFNNQKILSAIENEFGGITTDKPTFVESDDNLAAVCSDEGSHETAGYVNSIQRFLEENFYNELKSTAQNEA